MDILNKSIQNLFIVELEVTVQIRYFPEMHGLVKGALLWYKTMYKVWFMLAKQS